MIILWNGSKTEEFKPSTESVDKISPYLCMEKLAHLIQMEVDIVEWKPIRLSKNGPPITHFDDDFILFEEASIEQVVMLKECMMELCDSSVQRMNLQKTRLY